VINVFISTLHINLLHLSLSPLVLQEIHPKKSTPKFKFLK